MKKEFEELQKMIKGINNQETKRTNTSNPTIELRNTKEPNETPRIKGNLCEYKSKPLLTNLKFQDIYNLININVKLDSNKINNKLHSQYHGDGITSIHQSKQTKTQKKFFSIMNEIFHESNPKTDNKSSNKVKCHLNHHNPKRLLLYKRNNFHNKTNINYQEQKVKTKPSIVSRYPSYLTSNEHYTNKNNITEYQSQRYPINNWFTKQQEKYKNVFYQEKSNNIRNLVSITENKEHRITNTFYNNNRPQFKNNNINNTTTYALLKSEKKFDEFKNKKKPYAYDEALDNFSNRLFKKEPLLTQLNESRKNSYPTELLTSSNTTSFKKDSLITNYNK